MNVFTKPLLLFLFFLGVSAAPLCAQMTDEQKLQEVYGPTFFNGDQELKAQFLLLLQERIEYQQIPQTADEKYIHLDNVPLLNKFNPSLVHDAAVSDASTFNPLKYQMEFWARTPQVYRMNPNLVIVIYPQQF